MLSKEMKDTIRAEYVKVWSPRYDAAKAAKRAAEDTKNAAAIAYLPDGNLVIAGKRPIEKDFCFGERGYDYNEALQAADNARKNRGEFIRRNMEWYGEKIGGMESNEWFILIGRVTYPFWAGDSKIKSARLVRDVELVEAFGGQCYLRNVAGKEVEYDGEKYHVATAEEKAAIIAAYKEAAAEHFKKVKSYLKRYGLEKVHSWTYWIDA